jgi:hypothetical protein
MVTHYRVVFDISQKGLDWWLPAIGFLFLIAGIVLAWTGRLQEWTRWRITGYVFVGFSLFWTLVVLATTLREYLVLHEAYRNGHYSVVEGEVENFHPMPYAGHQDECFSVKGTSFCYSDFEPTAGFNNTASHGGPIRSGLPVRVAYVDGHILRIEVEEFGMY